MCKYTNNEQNTTLEQNLLIRHEFDISNVIFHHSKQILQHVLVSTSTDSSSSYSEGSVWINKDYKQSLFVTSASLQLPLLLSGSAGVHLLLAAVPEVEQSVVLVGAEVGEVPEQAVSEPLVPQHPRPPGFCQHGVVGPVITGPLFAAERPLAVGGGGVPASALLPARVLPLGVWQL